jgi:hypothetical protein
VTVRLSLPHAEVRGSRHGASDWGVPDGLLSRRCQNPEPRFMRRHQHIRAGNPGRPLTGKTFAPVCAQGRRLGRERDTKGEHRRGRYHHFSTIHSSSLHGTRFDAADWIPGNPSWPRAGGSIPGSPSRLRAGGSIRGNPSWPRAGGSIPGNPLRLRAGDSIPGSPLRLRAGDSIPGSPLRLRAGGSIPGNPSRLRAGDSIPGSPLRLRAGDSIPGSP